VALGAAGVVVRGGDGMVEDDVMLVGGGEAAVDPDVRPPSRDGWTVAEAVPASARDGTTPVATATAAAPAITARHNASTRNRVIRGNPRLLGMMPVFAAGSRLRTPGS
jgi:hypothetical protein